MSDDEVLAALDAAVEHLTEHGWDMLGFAMGKGESLVILRSDGALEYMGAGPTPPEVLAYMKAGE